MKKVIFIDRDGTLIKEPPLTHQVNSLEEMKILPYTISSLKKLQSRGYDLIIITNQDGLGTEKNPKENFDKINKKLLEILESEGVLIKKILTCPHYENNNCSCRKPKIGLIESIIQEIDLKNSYMIGDRVTDIEFAKNAGIKGILLDDWRSVANRILSRKSEIHRKTKETDIKIRLNLDGEGVSHIKTGLNFFDHMLEQIARHGSIDLDISCKGDLNVDEHHTIEDVAITLGQAISETLDDKRGINRFASVLPMDDVNSFVALDLSGRNGFMFEADFNREMVGDMPTEMIKHFFESFAESLKCNLHIKIKKGNTHHMVESAFKNLAICLKNAIRIEHEKIPSSKGFL
jgi:imidazoleglycerol-phosphate dehydratase/histidinol-phosphatase